jgi:alpha-mannosidase
MDQMRLRKFAARVAEIERAIHRRRRELPPLRLAPPGAGGPRAAAGTDWAEVPVGGQWGGYNQTAWLHGELVIPPEWAGEAVVLLVRLGDYTPLTGYVRLAGPEALAYLDGAPFAGIDRFHAELLLAATARGDERQRLAIEAFSARVARPHTLLQYDLATRDPDAAALAADLAAAHDALSALEPAGADATLLGRALDAALARVDFRRPRSDDFYASLPAARAAFAAALAGYRHGSRPRIVATGHAHIDVAWLWPLAQTRRKAARTFATALRLMEQYPEYRFTQSQPQLYQYVKEDEPALWEQIKARVAEGRWEPTGAMWLEADTNIPSGESLVRQFVYGQRFFEAEFGRRSTLLWLPDVFGYSWALPQIMRGAGIGHFMTSKLSWNQYNRFPHDTFLWRGADGAEVLTHFITTPTAGQRYFTYNGHMTAAEVGGTYREYAQKDINDELLYLFGWGDGGGGPTRAMLEAARRLGNMPGLPALEQGGAEAVFAAIEGRVRDPENAARLPVWEGELYFEYHRGTYTSQGRTKYAHRRAEVLLHEAELWSALADLPAAPLDDPWRLLLLQQFHDILPGSSIDEVYADAERDLAAVARDAGAILADALDRLVATLDRPTAALVVWNATPWPRRDPVECGVRGAEFGVVGDDGGALTVQPLEGASGDGGERRVLVGPPADGVPPLGYARWSAIDDQPPASANPRTSGPAGLSVGERTLENRFYRLELDERGLIRSLRDKRVEAADGGREVIAAGQRGNRLIAFEDKPLNYDAWDIDIFYQEKPYPLEELESLRPIERGPLRGGVEIRRRFLGSTIVQRLLLYRDLPRIDFQTEIEWHEHQLLLKAAFPVAVRAGRATYEIQFGSVERPTHWNTSWDRARFEVCAQRWADLSEGDYGVALLNDGKYGHDIRGQVMRLTLLKSGISPDPDADQGRHAFAYSLLPHPGDWRAGEVVAHAAALNIPPRARLVPGGAGARREGRFSLVECDRPGLVIATVKPASDGRGVVLRLYEAYGTRGPATLRFAGAVAEAEECNLLEERVGEVERRGRRELRLAVRPYELKTLRVVLAPSSPE